MIKKVLAFLGIGFACCSMFIPAIGAQTTTTTTPSTSPTTSGASAGTVSQYPLDNNSVNTALLKAPKPALRETSSQTSVAIFGGASVFNEGYSPRVDLDPYLPGMGNFKFDNNKSIIREVAGIRTGYTWDPSLIPLNADIGQPLLMPRAELELLYAPYQTKGNVPLHGFANASATDKVDIDSIVFSFLGTMHFRVNDWFHPYVGAGVGGAYMHVTSENLVINSAGGQDVLHGQGSDFVFVPQGVAGVEFDIVQTWSIFGEYKYLYYVDPRFTLDTHSLTFDGIGQNIVVAGLRYSF